MPLSGNSRSGDGHLLYSMVGISVTAVLRSHAQILENMAAKVEELARRTANANEAKRLRQLANSYQLFAMQHQRWFEDNNDAKAAEKSA
jgi:hypothetical protein